MLMITSEEIVGEEWLSGIDFAAVSLVLSGFAIYLGRFLRWNSWDALFSPTLVLDIAGARLY